MTDLQPLTQEQQVEKQFADFHVQVDTWKDEIASIEVKSVHDKAEMQQAKDMRLKLRQVRLDADKKKAELKEDALKYTRAIDFCYNSIVGEIKPLEAELKEKEDFVKLQEQAEREKVLARREAELLEWLEPGSPFPTGLDTMDEETYTMIREGLKAKRQQSEAEAKRLEQERIAREEADRAERERIAKENEALKAKADAEAKAHAEQLAKVEAEAKAKAKKQREANAKKIAEAEKRIGKVRELIPVLEVIEGKKVDDPAEILKTVQEWEQLLLKARFILQPDSQPEV
jgi:hypothetical protein